MRRGERRADVALYAPFAGALYEAEPPATGGAEVQSRYIARALADHGFRVVHVVLGDRLRSDWRGVEVISIRASYRRGGLTRRRAIMDALRRADARLFIQRSAGFETGVVGMFARGTGRPFVFSSSSAGDFMRERRSALIQGASLDEWPTRLQYVAGLRAATEIVVQTEEQRRLAQLERGLRSTVISSFCDPVPLVRQSRQAFVWIGGLSGVKDPLVYIELARRVPEAEFLMVAADRGSMWSRLADQVRALTKRVPNLRLIPEMSRAELLELYAAAIAIVSTSWFEGFPNTFLEAWARGVPALSLRVDPDSVIERHDLGVVCRGSFDDFATQARLLWERRDFIDPEPYRDYVARVHDPSIVGPRWAALVSGLLDG